MPKATINGVQLHYHAKGRGVPILCIHPPLLNSNVFRYQLEQLSASLRVVAFDIRGHGHSAPSQAPLTYPLIAEDMHRLLDHLGIEKAYLCGYSTGAGIALEFMLTHPDRCRGAVLLSGMSEMTDWYNRARLRLASGSCRIGAKRPIASAISWGNADSNTTFGNLLRSAMKGWLPNWRQYYDASMRYDCTDRLRDIRQPVLLLYGEKDKSFRKYARILHRELPDNRIYWIRGVSHQLPTKAPVAVSEMIRTWIEGQAPHVEEDPEETMLPAIDLLDGAVMREWELQ